ncbi:MAG: sigma-70 family RNA polymerase sigma factor [Paludisphaera borealis]|uniref:sigma-70 family RNA polymerase sigma factor n=1 Tax=Paludisphaera borealis TaxID=1387353 RepID=UPI0028467B68|nr:sigma-70 family RNA polymerase sigma factor [Paludisphaera borealis]MDR3621052.1 sigma-70 family RNA polymerase sigma factor [Paludisphaera borealis]
MAVEGSGAVPRSIHALLTAGTFGGLTDGQLIERFVTREGEAAERAFAALMDQHGPMVLRVCRGVLRNEHDAEDAFQATFLILARKARSIQSRTSLAAWLFGVAYHVAVDARSSVVRRRLHESEAGRAKPQAMAEATADDDAPVVREELARLPARYREAVLLCSIEGLTQQQAAERLGLPLGTVQSRLARGRERLRSRLARRGLAPASALIWASAESARAAPPPALMESTLRGALRFADGKSAGMISAAVAELTQGGLRAMFLHKMRMVAGAVIASLAFATGAGVLARQAAAPGPGDEPAAAKEAPRSARKDSLDAAGARRLALGTLAQAAAIDALPRFSYRASYRFGRIDPTRGVAPTLDDLRRALNGPVPEMERQDYRIGFSWDEARVLMEMTPGKSRQDSSHRFWTRTEAWTRYESNDKSSGEFTRAAGSAKIWKSLPTMFDYSYLRVAPHQSWWGRSINNNNSQTMSPIPPEDVSWTSLGTETVGGETCDVLDSPLRSQRLWVGRDSGRLRAALGYELDYDVEAMRDFHRSEALRRIAGKNFATYREYADWAEGQASEDQMTQLQRAWREGPVKPGGKIVVGEYIVFDDYREIAPGVWLPFRETRAFPHAENKIFRSELRVEEVGIDRDLAGRFAELAPKEGDSVKDERFAATIDYKFSAKVGDDEIHERAEAEHASRLEAEELPKARAKKAFAAMVGKPAPALPDSSWIGGPPPDVAGRPYLLHFWSTWGDSCKEDLPRLKGLADRGAIILDMRPFSADAEFIEQDVRDQQFGHPAFLETNASRGVTEDRIGGYPAGVFPYYVFVDAQGRVAGHGLLSEILDKFGPALIAKPKAPESR